MPARTKRRTRKIYNKKMKKRNCRKSNGRRATRKINRHRNRPRNRPRKRSLRGGSNLCPDFNKNTEVLNITTGGGGMWDGSNINTWGKTGQYYGLESHFDRFDNAFEI